jgi:UDP-2-acetamido-3-amino-2,3-dideoxy-glucuronate N-acetyltransferase
MNFFKHERAIVHPMSKIGEGTRIWANANIMGGAIIGTNCNICDNCFVEKGAVLGNHVTLKNGVCVFEGVYLEDDVFVGAGATFINDRYPRSNRQDEWTLEKTFVKKGATIGANSTLMCGITIGEYAVIGAGAVVTKSVPAYTIVVGNPANFVGFVCRCGRKLDKDLKCTCGQTYQLINHTVIPTQS